MWLLPLNLLAGILIGVFSPNWSTRVIAPFLWATAWCAYAALARRKDRSAFLLRRESAGREAPLGLSHLQMYFFIEYMTSLLSVLVFAVASGIARQIIRP